MFCKCYKSKYEYNHVMYAIFWHTCENWCVNNQTVHVYFFFLTYPCYISNVAIIWLLHHFPPKDKVHCKYQLVAKGNSSPHIGWFPCILTMHNMWIPWPQWEIIAYIVSASEDYSSNSIGSAPYQVTVKLVIWYWIHLDKMAAFLFIFMTAFILHLRLFFFLS